MSGICGVVRLDGRDCTADEICPMLDRLRQRGPDAGAVWVDGGAALGHALLATTPESVVEAIPFQHAQSGCVITADVRLDNRAHLLETLGLDNETRVIGDGELILRAYLKWGTNCPGHLLGDFAFAIWDDHRRRLFCARDQVGMRQLIYHHTPGSLFAFATEADAVIDHPDVPWRINDARIADYLEDLEAHDLTSTFYLGVYRLPAAHGMVVDGSVLRTWRYWEPELPPTLRLANDDAYAAAFREVFTDAVRVRLRAPPGKLGSMLSGGIDSGSVAAVASQLLAQAGAPSLPTFSATGSDPACIETDAIRAAQGMAHLAPLDIAIGHFSEYGEDLLRLSRQSSEPFDARMAMLRAVYLAAHKAGITVMLDGAGGDTTLMADDMVAWRLRRGDILGAWHEAAGAQRFWGAQNPSIKAFVNGARAVAIPEWLRSLRRRARAGRQEMHDDRNSLVGDALARSVDIAGRRAANGRHVALKLDGTCDDRRAMVSHPYIVVARERYDRIAAPLNIEPRDPFLDRRLLAFCLSLPADQIERRGWPKIILRRAMAGIVPDAVRWRVGKEHVGWEFEDAVFAHCSAKSDTPWSLHLRNYVKPERLTLADGPHQDELAVATRVSLRYLQWWISRSSG